MDWIGPPGESEKNGIKSTVDGWSNFDGDQQQSSFGALAEYGSHQLLLKE